MTKRTPTLDPRFIAAVDLVRRTGALEFQIRYSDDEMPVVWFACARHLKGPDGTPVAAGTPGGEISWDAAAGMTPYRAVFRLCETLVDAGTCQHCSRPTGVHDAPESMPMEDVFCWYAYDPELKTFRRGCEGDNQKEET